MKSRRIAAGILIGGHSTRMGGFPKGMLPVDGSGQTLVERSADRLCRAGIREMVLVGNGEAYSRLGIDRVSDPQGTNGPAAGLLGLFRWAQAMGVTDVIALACDMPFVSVGLLRRLVAYAPDALAVVPFRSRWEPLCARYQVSRAAEHLSRCVAADRGKLQAFVARMGSPVERFPLSEAETCLLQDWDSPSDLAATSWALCDQEVA